MTKVGHDYAFTQLFDFIPFFNSAYLKGFLQPFYTPDDAVVRGKEEQAFVFFLDFVDECEGKPLPYLYIHEMY